MSPFFSNALDDPFECRNRVNGPGDLVPGRFENVPFAGRQGVVRSFLIEDVEDQKSSVRKGLLQVLPNAAPHGTPVRPGRREVRVVVQSLLD
ncbi:MAG: hypothetical protein BRD30_02275 [Bacteroidetes bacterium QH_2_63_10]|nr:MAG: hypothetical protein BRD30_02275 [Bacteroidetes bacterium QH_2_63_10]